MENTAKKLPTNLSIRSDLLREAKKRKINLSQTLEERLEEILREQIRLAWREENREGGYPGGQRFRRQTRPLERRIAALLMAQFDIYANPNQGTGEPVRYLPDL